MKVFWLKIIDLNLFFQFLRGRCLGNQFSDQIAQISADFFARSRIISGSAGPIFTVFAWYDRY